MGIKENSKEYSIVRVSAYNGLNCVPPPTPNLYVETSTPHVTVFADTALMELIMAK